MPNTRTWEPSLVVIAIQQNTNPQLANVAQADRAIRRSAGFAENGQNDPDQHRDDPHPDEKLDQSKTAQ